ncbi:MAG: AbgT family transporter [Pirellulaceae bacterium]
MSDNANKESDLSDARKNSGLIDRFLNFIEVAGNKLPDPAILFLLLLVLVWILSWPLSLMDFGATHPITDDPIVVANQVNGSGISNLLTSMVRTFVNFAPLGVVLVALLGIGVAEHTGLISVMIKSALNVVSKSLLTPAIILVGIASHYAVDAGYVLVIPIGGVVFYAAGRHPLAGIAAAFAGVSGGFSANFFIPSALDPLLQGFTLEAAQLYDPNVEVSIVNNNVFTAVSTVLIVLVGWFITDRIVEPRVQQLKVDGDPEHMPKFEDVKPEEIRGMIAAFASVIIGVGIMIWWAWPLDSVLRYQPAEGNPFAVTAVELPEGLEIDEANGAISGSLGDADSADVTITVEEAPQEEDPNAGSLLNFQAPLMRMIVPLIFLFSVVPGIVHGYVAGTVKSHKDIVKGMTAAMETMAYYLVLAFFCALFIWMFDQTHIGLLLAVKGAGFLKSLGLPGAITIFGIIILVGLVNLLVGSASAKWALISAVFVPMLMDLGISPDLTQAAYRVGDSSTNIITPLMPYFPLVVVFCQRYVKDTGIGTLVSIMLPYSVVLIVLWSVLLIIFWGLGIPLGTDSNYVYTPPVG